MSASFLIPQDPSPESDHPLAHAFPSFSEAAGSLKHSCEQLHADIPKNPPLLVESARQMLGRALLHTVPSEDGGRRSSGLQLSFMRRILDCLRQLAGEQVAQTAPALLCSTPARFNLRRLLEPFLPKVVALSPPKIPPMVPVQSLGMVR